MCICTVFNSLERRVVCMRMLRKYQRSFSTNWKEKHKPMEKWNSVVGLEIHAQITCSSKLFSGASTEFGSPVNSCVSFFDCAMPGTLPVLNKKCVESGILTALALSCNINEYSTFDRKHYFYSDLPAGFQITQQRQPIATGGHISFHVNDPKQNISYTKVSKIKQVQLEQDSGKSIHDEETKRSLVDLNRAGIALMEIVFEPDLRDGKEAAALVKELVLILQRLDTCSCKMAEGALRVDANISINKPNETLGVRTEVKNIGSIRALASAIDYEIKRQTLMANNGYRIFNETRAWDADSNQTVSMRDKTEEQDYRFIPEPNLSPLYICNNGSKGNNEGIIDVMFLKTQIPELPQETRKKLKDLFGLSSNMIIALTGEPQLLQIFTAILSEKKQCSAKLIANFLVNELLRLVNQEDVDLQHCCEKEHYIGDIIQLLLSGSINLQTARKILNEVILHPVNPPRTPTEIVESNCWWQLNNDLELEKMCTILLTEKADLVKKYKRGKIKIFRHFLGQIASATEEKANMEKVSKILKRLLS